ncbi:MAG: 1,4-alpha-glucan-branching protein [Chitinophagaceae bacterium]|nr:1,4-alpha-glucan-branching protein [Chitinophagaceae bacterium]
MKKYLLLYLFIIFSTISNAQRLLTWTPEFPKDNDQLVITIDCSKGNQGLFNFEGGNSNNVYVHAGLHTNLSNGPNDWKYSKFTWGTADPAAKAVPLGNNKYQYTINNIRTLFGVAPGEIIKKVNIIFRSADGNLKQTNSDNSDMYIPVYGADEFAVRLNLPVFEPRFIPWVEPVNATIGDHIDIEGVASANANLTLKLNGNIINNAANGNIITANPEIVANCNQKVVLEGNNGQVTQKDSFSFFVSPATIIAPLPAGVQDGINYAANNTEVTLVLFAPGKNNVLVIGDFSDWAVQCQNQMKRTPDNNRYHITLTGLTPGTIYKFQYVVDGSIKTTDPYTELILDPNNDQYINPATFPGLPVYPANQTTGIVGTFQTAAPAYTWTANNYTRPDKKNLIIYELLVRDFLTDANWQTLADTLDYIKKLGVNAIEVMPFNEFEGNNSWGYNPDFFFAPDKAYGTKNNLKKFIDEAHKRGIAVIMDAVLNHATGLSPLAQLYWDGNNNAPAANSPYFNVTAKHPFNVFNDFNHESEATKYHTARYIRHWLTEYRLDGFRWDLSKGFTQKECGDVNCWNNFDANRIATWQRYYDSSQVVSAGSYNILEHLGNDDEEAELASRGMLLWGKMTDQFNQNTMGYPDNSSISRAYYKNRAGWAQPHLVTYAESHDEERIIYKNTRFGNTANPDHNVKDIATALKRTEAMYPFLLLIPGPKMIWQFGELGYDASIFQCPNETVPEPYGNDECKLDPKPVRWNYLQQASRKRIYDVVSSLNRLRSLKPNVFLSGIVTGNLGSDLKNN